MSKESLLPVLERAMKTLGGCGVAEMLGQVSSLMSLDDPLIYKTDVKTGKKRLRSLGGIFICLLRLHTESDYIFKGNRTIEEGLILQMNDLSLENASESMGMISSSYFSHAHSLTCKFFQDHPAPLLRSGAEDFTFLLPKEAE